MRLDCNPAVFVEACVVSGCAAGGEGSDVEQVAHGLSKRDRGGSDHDWRMAAHDPEGSGHAGKEHAPEARPSGEQGAAIRSMVDGLAERLESAPRDIEGWTRLMRSRVVLGEREAATAAFAEVS